MQHPDKPDEPKSSASEPPHTLRVWFDMVARVWCATRWDNIGGIARGKTLVSGSPCIRSSGADLIFTHARLAVNTDHILATQDQDITVDRMDVQNPPHGKGEYRLRYEPLINMWVCGPVDGPGGTCKASSFISTERLVSDGRFLRFYKAEAKEGTQEWLQNGDMAMDELRIMPISQFVGVPVVAQAGSAMKVPGG